MEKISQLKQYFQTQPAAVLAFVFGSFAQDRAMADSDFDIAVYLKDGQAENKIRDEISGIVQREIDLVSLDEAPASLVANIFKTGIPLAVKNKKLFWELYLRKSLEAEDFLEFAEDFWRIKQRAESLAGEDKVRLMVRIDFLKTEIRELAKFETLSLGEYQENLDKRKIVERSVENVLNATIDIAKIILASEKKAMPRDYKGALLNFGLLAGLDEQAAGDFSQFADLRNLLAHEYLDILYGRIRRFIDQFSSVYQKIFEFLSRYLGDN